MASSLLMKPLPTARALFSSGLHRSSSPASFSPLPMPLPEVGANPQPFVFFATPVDRESIIKRISFLDSNGAAFSWRTRSLCTANALSIQRSSPCFLTRVPEGRHACHQRCFCTSSPGSGNANYAPHNSSTNSQTGPQQPWQQQSHQTGQQPPNRTQASSSSTPNNIQTSAPAAGSSSNAPRTSAAAEVIDKYLGPSTLKLDKPSNSTPPPPPPKRNFGPQGTQEKKSGKDLVAESAACAVIEKYLGPWPGFPPRDPKIDEYLDSLPENAACAAIDKYFGPYKPLFVFKKNEENANNPPPPSRPPRSRMMNRARNRTWNNPQEQGGSGNRPWSGPQQGTNAGSPTPTQVSGTMPPSQASGSSPSQTPGSQTNTQGSSGTTGS